MGDWDFGPNYLIWGWHEKLSLGWTLILGCKFRVVGTANNKEETRQPIHINNERTMDRAWIYPVLKLYTVELNNVESQNEFTLALHFIGWNTLIFFFFFKLVFYIIIIISIFGRISGSVSYHIYLTKWTSQQLKCGCFGAVELGSRGWNGRVGIVMEWRVGVWWLADWHNVLVWEWWRSPELQKERREKGVGL